MRCAQASKGSTEYVTQAGFQANLLAESCDSKFLYLQQFTSGVTGHYIFRDRDFLRSTERLLCTLTGGSQQPNRRLWAGQHDWAAVAETHHLTAHASRLHPPLQLLHPQ